MREKNQNTLKYALNISDCTNKNSHPKVYASIFSLL